MLELDVRFITTHSYRTRFVASEVLDLVLDFLETLAFPTKNPEDWDNYYVTLVSGLLMSSIVPNWFSLEKLRELSLLLRLFVALGGNLNVELSPYLPNGPNAVRPNAVIKKSMTNMQYAFRTALQRYEMGGEAGCPIRSTLAAEMISDFPAFILVILVAGRRLHIRWDVVSVQLLNDNLARWHCATAFQLAYNYLISLQLIDTDDDTDDDDDISKNLSDQERELLKEFGVNRLCRVAGELGVLYSLHGPRMKTVGQLLEPVFNQKRFKRRASLPLFIAEPLFQLTRETLSLFERDDASPYEFSETDEFGEPDNEDEFSEPDSQDAQDVQSCLVLKKTINARRRAYRRSIRLHIGVSIGPTVLGDLIAAYVLAPRAMITRSPFF